MTSSDGENDSPRLLKTVGLTCEIMQALKDGGEAGVTELSERLDLSKGAVYNHLATLREHGLVVQNGDSYELGLRFVNFGEFVKNQSILFQEGIEEADNLAARTGEYAHLMAFQHDQGIHIYRAEGENAVGDEYYHRKQEKTDPLYYSATGKAVLAFLPENRVEQILEQGELTAQTEHTITDSAKLREELSQIRERGFALNDEEQFLGLRAVGAPIRDSNNQVIGAISISGPVTRISDARFTDEIPQVVTEVSNIIEVNIQQSRALSE